MDVYKHMEGIRIFHGLPYEGRSELITPVVILVDRCDRDSVLGDLWQPWQPSGCHFGEAHNN